MSHKPSYYICLAPDRIDELCLELADVSNLQPSGDSRYWQHWFDTFDWRLQQANQALLHRHDEQGRQTLLYQLDNGEVLARIPDLDLPRFPEDLPPSRLSEHLSLETPPRALLELVSYRVQQQDYEQLDEERKVRCRVAVWRMKPVAIHPDASPTPLAVVIVQTLKGYQDDAAVIRQWLGGHEEFVKTGFAELYRQLVRNGGREPGDYSSKLELELDPEQTTDSALRDILEVLADNLAMNLQGTLDDHDSEFLHDFRVSVRRSRSALKGIKKALPDDATTSFATDLKWLGSLTGESRDLDVYLLAMPDFAASLSDNLRPSLQPFASYLQERKQLAHATLCSNLRSERMQRFMQEWQGFLAQTQGDVTDIGSKPIRKTAGAAIWKCYNEVIRDGSELHADSPAESFHALRKDMKKLRYLMELFASLYPPKAWKKQLKLQKALQTILGNFQDYEVQAEFMLDNARELIKRPDCPAETLIAMGVLYQQLQDKQAHALDHFDEAFSELASGQCRKTFEQLCKRSDSKG